MDNDNAMPFLAGERVYLRGLLDEDADGSYPAWFNDPATCAGNSHHVFPYSREEAREFIRRSRGRRDAIILAIVRRSDGRHVGNISLQDIHPIYRSAEFAIVLGDSSARGQGLGREAGLLLCRHGFEEMNLHRIGCGTFENNGAMVRLAGALGMREEGRRRQAAFKGGRWLDVLEFGVLQEDYFTGRP